MNELGLGAVAGASIGPGGIEMPGPALCCLVNIALQLDRGELKYVPIQAGLYGGNRFNWTGGN